MQFQGTEKLDGRKQRKCESSADGELHTVGHMNELSVSD
jgi:hypothetical protein